MDPLRILALHRQNSAVAYYRTWTRCRSLRDLGHDVKWWEHDTYQKNLRPDNYRKTNKKLWAEKWLLDHLDHFDLLLVDRAIRHDEVRIFSGFQYYSREMRAIVDMDDDFMQVPKWNPAAQNYKPGTEAYQAGIYHLRTAEMVTVSTETLKKRFAPHSHQIRVIPNLIDPEDWAGLPTDPSRSADPSLRVLYGGASGHYGDLDAAREGIESMIRSQPVPWRLVCFGALPAWLHDLAKELPGRVVPLPWIPFRDYPQAVAWGGFDLAIAPLVEHPFNQTKSNIKWLEAGIQGIPFMCSDVGPYQTDIPAGCAMKVANTPAQWATGLRDLLTDKYLRSQFVRAAREAVLDSFTLDKGRKRLENVLEEVMDLPRVETLADTRLPADQTTEQAT